MEKVKEIERSIIKKFRKSIWNRFIEAVVSYDLIEKNDKIAVCISGGKDSFLMAKLLQELQRHGHTPFSLEFICMDPGYTKENREKIESNAALMGLPLHIFNTNIFNTVVKIENSPCYLCARMRRGHLYHFAKQLGCNKIALGHHFNDVIETVLMSMLYSGQIQGMMPKLHSTNFSGMELIRPLFCVKEEDILHWAAYNQLSFLNCACRFTEQAEMAAKKENAEQLSKRKLCKNLIAALKQDNDLVDVNLFRSLHQVHLDTLISYKKNGEEHHFLKDY